MSATVKINLKSKFINSTSTYQNVTPEQWAKVCAILEDNTHNTENKNKAESAQEGI